MNVHEFQLLSKERSRRRESYLEFLRVPSMSGGLYELRKGAADPQSPHAEDEVYYVVRGHARIRVGEEDEDVHAGCIVFVPARMDHHFHDIKEDLAVLVFFAPAEGTSSRR